MIIIKTQFQITVCLSVVFSCGCLKCHKESPHFSAAIKRHVYKYDATEKLELRSTNTYLQSMKQVDRTSKPHRGYRQATSVYFLMYPYYDNFWISLVIDGLHTLDRGVSVAFFEQLFGDHNKAETFYLGKTATITLMDDVLNSIQVPIGVKKPPKIRRWRSWKAIDFRNFMCYYAIFVFSFVDHFANSKYYKTIAKYCDVVRVLYSRSIHTADLDSIQDKIKEVNGKQTYHASTIAICYYHDLLLH